MDIRTERLARLLVEYSVKVQPGERVVIRAPSTAAPLVRAVYEQVLLQGGYPFLHLTLPELEEIFYENADSTQLAFIEPVEKQIIEEFDVMIGIQAPANTRALSAVDPKKQQKRSQARQPLLQRYMERSANGELKWVGTLFPTHAGAQEADMSLRRYEDFVYATCYCDHEDPVAEWRRIHEEQQRIIDWLEGREQVKIGGPNAELTLSIAGRTFVNSDGHHNMPSGEIFTGPVEDSVNGWVRFTYPSIAGGREVEGIELWFEEGKVVKAKAKKNEPYLLEMLDTDERSRYLGEFAIGTNYQIREFTKNILFDEKIGGSFHVAIGAGYPETGSQNRSAVHWDMICDMQDGGEIWVDGELLYRDGKFVI
ncbi:MAG: aminopeptidase [Anaerolineae bacterium]